jgi:hypothetical protein
MPFINEASINQISESFTPYEYKPESDFSEVFGASIGLVVDEELSISSGLNREGFQARNALINERIKAGEIDISQYQSRYERVQSADYNRIAKDLNDPAIKTDEILHQERNEMLANRRAYAQDVIDRGSGMAQFMGSLNAYALDPINIATVGIAAPATTARATSVVARAALASRDAALISGVSEIGIQALVYEHKNDIQSPYSARDALANIGFAALGSAAIGGVTGGLSGWIEKVLKVADKTPQTAEIKTSIAYLQRQKSLLEAKTKLDQELGIAPATTPKEQIQSDINYLSELDKQTTLLDKPKNTADIYQITERTKQPPASASQREREILTRQGIADHYDADMGEFNAIENPIIRIDNEDINPTELIKQFDDEIKGLDEVLRCTYG